MWLYYALMVSEYNVCEFTFSGDTVNAFKGIEAYLEPVFGSIIFGLSEAHFNLALLWEPTDTNAKKRETSILIPSWPWMKWQSKIEIYMYWKHKATLIGTAC